MKNILKLSLVSLCASGAVFSTQANNDNQSASNIESDKQLVVTEPAGADSSASAATTSRSWQTSGTTYQSGITIQGSSGPVIYESAGAPIGAPRMVTGRDQDCYADCILHQYQRGKGSARVTDEHYWNNVQGDRMYAQYPASGAMYRNYAYTSYGSQPVSSSQWSSSAFRSQSGQIWYGPDGKMYDSATSMTPLSASATASSSLQSNQKVEESSGAAQSSATQPSTSGSQSSTELKSTQTQPGTATQESAGAQTGTESPQSATSTENQPSTSSTSTSPDQTSTSTQSSTSTSAEGMTEKVRSTLQSDTTLSPLSSNVTVQDQNGKVALNGTVKSEAEKQQIVSKAEEIAGSGNVIDNLQIKSDSNSNP